MVRFLRPDRIVASGGVTWLVDESWSVTAVVSEDGGLSLVSWAAPGRGEGPAPTRTVVADGVGIVVHEGAQVAWVRRDGCTIAQIADGLTLAAADPETAWFVDRSSVDPGRPPDPPPPMPEGRIVALRRDGTGTVVTTPAPVNAIGLRGTDLWITIAEPPLSHPSGHSSYRHEYPRSVLRVGRDDLFDRGLETAVPATGQIPVSGGQRSWDWLESETDIVARHGVHACGLVWWAGAPQDGDRIERRVVAVGHDTGSGEPLVRIDLGLGIVRDVQPVGEELWLVVARRRFLAVPRDRGIEAIAVSASGASLTVVRPDAVDVSSFAPVLQRPTQERIREHTDEVRRMFDDLEHYWTNPDGETSPLSAGLTDASVMVEGDWPQTRVVVRMRHPRRPGLVLRRTMHLFDEQGAPIEYEHGAIFLMEQLDTGYLAPADETVDGVLDT